MIIATVTTCPQRWNEYRMFRGNFAALGLAAPLRTFQTSECAGDPLANNNLNARSALAYCNRHLPSDSDWVLYLEDDVRLNKELTDVLPRLMQYSETHEVDVWYLCNRKNPVREQFRLGPLAVNRLDYPIDGSHGLLIPKRHLPRILDAHWGQVADRSMFAAIHAVSWTVLQIVEPVLVEHVGEYSTYDPQTRRPLEINYAY